MRNGELVVSGNLDVCDTACVEDFFGFSSSFSRKNSNVLDSKLVLAGRCRMLDVLDDAVLVVFVVKSPACAFRRLSSSEGLDESEG